MEEEIKPLTRKQKFSLKLIELYEQNECLWNENLKAFYNKQLKKRIWESIAAQMGPKVTVGSIKKRIHLLRYKATVRKIYERGALLNKNITKPPNVYYANKFNFLNRMFDRTRQQFVTAEQEVDIAYISSSSSTYEEYTSSEDDGVSNDLDKKRHRKS